MSEEGGNLPHQGAEEIHGGGHTSTITTTTTNTPTGSAKIGCCSNSSSDSGKSDASKPASPAVIGDAATDLGEEEERGGGGAMDGSGGAGGGESKAKSSSAEGGDDDLDDELKDDVAGGANGGGIVGGSGSGDSKVEAADAAVHHALHVWTERERRKKMKIMFSRLQGLLPRLPEKADKTTIVDETISYIKTLQGVIQRLERLKMERAFATADGDEGSSSSQLAPAAARTLAPSAPATREAALAALVHGWNAAAEGRSAAAAAVAAAWPAPPPLQTWTGPNMTVSMSGNDAFLTLSLPRQQKLLTTAVSVLEKHRIDVVTATVTAQQDRCLFSLHVQLHPAGSSSDTLTSEDRYKLALSELMLWLSN